MVRTHSNINRWHDSITLTRSVKFRKDEIQNYEAVEQEDQKDITIESSGKINTGTFIVEEELPCDKSEQV